MPSVDNRIVRLKFDNASFEQHAKQTINTLEKLKEKMNFKGVEESFKGITIASSKVDLSHIDEGIENTKTKLDMLGVIGTTALVRLANSAVNAGNKIIKSVIGPLTSGGWNRASNIEAARFKLEGLGVAGKDLELVWQNVTDAVDGTAYSLDAAALVAAQLAASGMRGGKDMAESLRAISGVASVTGSSYEDIGRIFTQVAGQGRMMGDQLLQLSGRGMNAAATMAKYFNKTEAEIRDMVTKGEISFKMFSEAMNNAFGDSAMRANETLTGVLANVRSALAKIGADFVTPFITNLSTEGHVSNLVELMNRVRESINEVRKALDPFREAITQPLLKVIQGITGYLEKFNTLTTPVTTELTKVSKTVEKVTGDLRHLEEVARLVIRGDFGNGAVRVKALTEAGYDYATVQGMVNEIMWGTYDASKYAGEKISETTEVMEESTVRMVNFRDALAQGFGNLVNIVVKPIEAVLTAFGEVFKIEDSVYMINLLSNAFMRLTDRMVPTEKTINAIRSTFNSLFTTVKAVITALIIPFNIAVKVGEILITVFQKLTGTVLTLISGFAKLFAFPFQEFNNIVSKLFINDTFIQSIKEISEGVKLIKESFKTLKTTLFNAAISFANALGGPFSDFSNWLKNLRESFENGTVNLIASAMNKIAKVVTKVATVINSWVSKTSPKISEWATKSSSTLKKWIDGPISKISSVFTTIKTTISNWADSGIKMVSDWFNNTKTKIGTWVDHAGTAFENFKNGPASKVGNVFSNIKDSVFDWFQTTMPKVTEWSSKTWNTIKEWSSKVIEVFKKWYDKCEEPVKEFFKNTIKKLVEWSEEFGTKFKDFGSKAIQFISDFTSKASEKIKGWYVETSPMFEQWKTTALDSLSGLAGFAGDALTNIKQFFSELKNGFTDLPDMLGKLVNNIVNGIANFKGFDISIDLSEVFGNTIGSFFKTIKSQGEEVVNHTTETVKKTKTSVTKAIKTSLLGDLYEFVSSQANTFLSSAKESISNLCSGIAEGFTQSNIENVKALFEALIDGALKISAIRTIWQLGDLFKSLKTTVGSFGGIADSIKGFFKSWSKAAPKTDNVSKFKSFAQSVAILAGCIAVLSCLPVDRAWGAVGMIVTIVAILGGVMIGVSKLTKGTKGLSKATQGLFKLAAAVALLTIPIAILSYIPLGNLAQGLSAVGLELLALVGVMAVLSRLKNINSVSKGLLGLAAAMTLMVVPILIFSLIPWETFKDGGTKALMVLVALTGAMAAIGYFAKNSLKGAASSLVAMAAALTLLIIPISVLGNMEWQTLVVGMIAVGVGVAILAGAVTAIGYFAQGGLAGAAAALLALALSINLLLIPIVVLSAIPFETLAQGLTITGFALLAMVGALIVMSKFGGGGLASSATALLLLAAALTVLAVPIIIFSYIPYESLANGLKIFALGLLALVVAALVAGFMPAGFYALAAAATGVGAGVLLAAAGLVLGAAAIWLIADALSMLASLAPGAGTAIVQAIAEIAQGVREHGFEIGVNLVAGIIQGLAGAVVGVIAGVIELGKSMVDAIKDFLGIHSPSTVGESIGNDFDEGFANGVRNAKGTVESASREVGESVKKATREGAEGAEEVGEQSAAGFATGYSNESVWTPLGEYAKQQGINITERLGEGAEGGFSYLKQTFSELGFECPENFFENLGSVDASAYTSQFTGNVQEMFNSSAEGAGEAGNQTSLSYLEGLTSNTDSFQNAGTSMMDAFISGIETKSADVGLIGIELAERLSTNLNNGAANFTNAGSQLMDRFIAGMRMKQAEPSQIVIQMVDQTISQLKSQVANFTNTSSSLIDAFIQGIRNKKASVIDAMVSMALEMIAKMNAKSGEFTKIGNTYGLNVAEGILKGSGPAYNNARAVASAAREGFASYIGVMSSIGANFSQGLANGIASGASAVISAAIAVASAALRAAKDALAVKSPSRLMFEVGEFFDIGLENGILSRVKNIKDAASKYALGAVDSAEKEFARFPGLGVFNESNPTITPVVDLSNVESALDSIDKIFNIAKSSEISMNTSASVNNSRNQNGLKVDNNDVVTALKELKEYLKESGGHYTINGITYDNGSQIEEAVQTLIRAAKLERRV